jgi:hypothetical protein
VTGEALPEEEDKGTVPQVLELTVRPRRFSLPSIQQPKPLDLQPHLGNERDGSHKMKRHVALRFTGSIIIHHKKWHILTTRNKRDKCMN